MSFHPRQFLRRLWNRLRRRSTQVAVTPPKRSRGRKKKGPNATQKLGVIGETLAVEYLVSLGYQIVDTHVFLENGDDGAGELDIIATDGKTLVFVEVKARERFIKYHPFDTVTAKKMRQVAKLGRRYRGRTRSLYWRRVRYDVVGVLWSGNPAEPAIIYHSVAAFPERIRWSYVSNIRMERDRDEMKGVVFYPNAETLERIKIIEATGERV